ncbi:hypothetical protein [Arenicella xantha]|uniref:DUF3592 domain-containing protein n=1 Tax=Arenicella xantha TaxID=644221 RepID=A0A395JKQ2_9GAMM|nr:hypothetical protein [Arenicella xantha]RBP49358.1 hypothetical protein DFR28_104289 [Arenicella xantha]
MILKLIGIIIFLAPLYFFIVPMFTKKWPTTRAQVVELTSNKKKGVSGWLLDPFVDTDYGIEYIVDSRKYAKNPHIEAYTQVSGFRKNYFPVVPWEFELRYHPNNPERFSLVHAYKKSVVWVTTLIAAVIGLGIIWNS